MLGIFCGKTITDEVGLTVLNGQNIHYGTTLNPVTPDRPLQAGRHRFGGGCFRLTLGRHWLLGTDTGGFDSCARQATTAWFGLRPTHAVIPSDNMVALARFFDTVGCLPKRFNAHDGKNRCIPFEKKVQLKKQYIEIKTREKESNNVVDCQTFARSSSPTKKR